MISLATLLVLKAASTGRWALANGTQVSAVVMSTKDRVVWRPDGSPVNFLSVQKLIPMTWPSVIDEPAMVVLTNQPFATGIPPTFRFKLESTPIFDASIALLSKGDKLWVGGFVLPKGQPLRQDVAVGIADGPWKVKGWIAYTKHGAKLRAGKHVGIDFEPEVGIDIFTSPDVKAKLGTFAITMPPLPNTKDEAIQIVARGARGNELYLTGSGRKDVLSPTTYFFHGDLLDLRRIEWQTRPMEWKTLWGTRFAQKENP